MLQTLLLAVAAAATLSSSTPTKTIPDAAHHAGGTLPRASRCVDGTPASLPTDGGWPIDYAEVSLDPDLLLHYTVAGSWYADHYISSTTISIGPGNDLYAAFKCQFVCNAAPDCVSYFGKYVDFGSGTQNYQCTLFDDLLEPSVFVSDNGTVPGGGFNKLCDALPSSSGESGDA
ncbi:hypothetical protein QBC33DRAFT_555869 [Phialemonium atrogriseum]|uniref:Apple domain-containing protein n=1 Tax=Phialemonium atrogriseum TaxID=1093897 RepID=A0AAJ0FRQ2_9PEZI|nr:uncharacterized protein QBC33DRAFT_555869 [Phialemonium atrogriseum]KAK1770385.1 hypothetical protein QBC33DRAFT_555869 [Phialemonium atrogriseum]